MIMSDYSRHREEEFLMLVQENLDRLARIELFMLVYAPSSVRAEVRPGIQRAKQHLAILREHCNHNLRG